MLSGMKVLKINLPHTKGMTIKWVVKQMRILQPILKSWFKSYRNRLGLSNGRRRASCSPWPCSIRGTRRAFWITKARLMPERQNSSCSSRNWRTCTKLDLSRSNSWGRKAQTYSKTKTSVVMTILPFRSKWISFRKESRAHK